MKFKKQLLLRSIGSGSLAASAYLLAFGWMYGLAAGPGHALIWAGAMFVVIAGAVYYAWRGD